MKGLSLHRIVIVEPASVARNSECSRAYANRLNSARVSVRIAGHMG